MSDNPFAKLQSLLNHKDSASPSAPAKGSSPSPSSSNTVRPTSRHKKPTEHDEESALFLHTVNKLPQSVSGAQAQQEDTVFKQAMQAAGILPVGKKVKGKKHKNRSSSRASMPPQSQDKALADPSPHHNARQDKASQTRPSHPSSATRGKEPVASSPFREPTQNRLISDDFDEQESALFAKAMGNVAPVSKRGREVHTPSETKAPLHPSGKTPAQIMQEIIDGRIEFAIQHTGEYMEGFVQGVSPEVLEKLRLGQLSPEGHVDLHGLNALQAYTELTRFIKNAYQRNMRTVTVITGRGINSPDGIAVIRNLIQEWLTHDPFKRVVLAFCSAQPRDGGAGALYVLLRKYKKSMGKIQWELPYAGPNADF